MKWALRATRRFAGMAFPWPAKHERQAAIAAARRGKERSRAACRRAQEVERQISRLASNDPFARAIAEQILRDTR